MRLAVITPLLVFALAMPYPAQAAPQVGQNLVSVYFDSKKWNLDKDAREALDAVIPQLKDATSLRIDGYVQAAEPGQGTKRYLSRDRAESVAKHLEQEFKKRRWKIDVSVRGMGRPAANFRSPFARRAEVVVTGVK